MSSSIAQTPVCSHPQIWAALEALTDPEIPVVTLRELGILREVRDGAGGLEVVITPTYSGCPAMGQIEDDVRRRLGRPRDRRPRGDAAGAGLDHRLDERRGQGEAARLRHRAAACGRAAASRDASSVVRFSARAAAPEAVPCPQCGSQNTTETSHFGSTACKALYRCLDCLEPFDYFKPY